MTPYRDVAGALPWPVRAIVTAMSSTSSSPRASLARGTVVVAAALALAQVLAYLVSIVAARALGPVQFGAFAALLGVLLIGNVVALGLQAVIARQLVTVSPEWKGPAARSLLRTGLVAGAAVCGAALLIAPLLRLVLRLDDWWPLVIVALTLLPLTWIGAQLGVAQGRESYARLAGVYASVGVGRGVGGVLGALVGQSTAGALWGILLGTLAGALVSRGIVAALAPAGRHRIAHLLRQVAHASHALLALFVLTNVDVILARALLDAEAAGEYGVGAVIAKIAFWLPQFVGVVLFPRLADARRALALVITLAAVGGLGGLVVAGTALLPGLVVQVAGGPAYQGLVPLAWLFALVGALFALAQALLLTRLAVDDRRAAVAIWSAIAVLVLLATMVAPRTVGGLATSAAIAGGALCLAGIVQAIREHRPRRASGHAEDSPH